jgi:beta-lactam-binding protein with PASTA domain
MKFDKSKIQEFRTKHPIISTIIAICFTSLILIWICLIFLDFWTMHGRTSTVPQIKNLSFAEARFTLSEANLEIEISDSIYDKTLAPGTVVESWPKAGAVVKRGRQVYVTINAFSPKQIAITKPISGVSARQAISYLQALGITITEKHVPSQYEGLVERATVDGRPLGVGSIIPITSIVTLEVGTIQTYDDSSKSDDQETESDEAESNDTETEDDTTNAFTD